MMTDRDIDAATQARLSPGATPMTPTSPVTLSREVQAEAEALLLDIEAAVASNRDWARYFGRVRDLIARVASARAVTETPEGLCPCAGACHHDTSPCSLGCWAAHKPWRVEEAALDKFAETVQVIHRMVEQLPAVVPDHGHGGVNPPYLQRTIVLDAIAGVYARLTAYKEEHGG